MRHLWLLVCCLTACGDDGVRHTPDASPHDGPIADMAPDGPPAPVTVTATIDGTPQAGVQVWFLNADNSLVMSTMTDASGVASAVMAAGGSVTALDPYYVPPPPAAIPGGGHQLYTFMAVKPGDNLLLAQQSGTTTVVVTVNAPIDSAAGVVSYEAWTPCGYNPLTNPGSGANPTGQVSIEPACGAATDFLLVSRDDANQIVDYAYVPNVAITNNGTVDLTTATWAAGATRTFSFTNIPAGYGGLNITDSILTAHGAILGQTGYSQDGSAAPVTTVGMGAHVSQVDVYGSGNGRHTFIDWGAYADTYTADVGVRVLPDLLGFPTVDPSAHTVTVDEAASGVTPDVTLLPVYTYRQSDNTSWEWFIAAPHTTTLTMPTLPTDLYNFNIDPTDNFNAEGVGLAKVPGGYDAVRPYIFNIGDPTSFANGSTGSATLETVFGKIARTGRSVTMAGHAPPLLPRLLSRRVR